MKKERDYANIDRKIRAKVSLVSAGMILLLPLLTKISLVMPIKIYLIFDIIGVLIALLVGYRHARNSIIDEYYLKNFLINKRYKATMISIKQQIRKLFQSTITLIIGFVMAISFNLGFLVVGVSMLILLLLIYPFMRRSIKSLN